MELPSVEIPHVFRVDNSAMTADTKGNAIRNMIGEFRVKGLREDVMDFKAAVAWFYIAHNASPLVDLKATFPPLA